MSKLVEVTPPQFRPQGGAPTHGPAVFREKRGQYVIIGSIFDTSVYEELKERIGKGELAIEVPAELLNEVVAQIVKGNVNRALGNTDAEDPELQRKEEQGHD